MENSLIPFERIPVRPEKHAPVTDQSDRVRKRCSEYMDHRVQTQECNQSNTQIIHGCQRFLGRRPGFNHNPISLPQTIFREPAAQGIRKEQHNQIDYRIEEPDSRTIAVIHFIQAATIHIARNYIRCFIG